MIAVFKEAPAFEDYGNSDVVKAYWTTSSLGGGPLINNVKTPTVLNVINSIQTPLN